MEIKVQRHTDLDSLLKAAASIEGRIFYLAGGTDLMVQAHAGVLPPATWLEISDVPQLHGISVEGSELRIGAGVTHHEIMRSQLVQTWAPALAQASANVGGPQIRSRGTIGGNLANASPVADTVPALYSLGAQLHLISQRGERTVAVEEFALAPRRNVLEPGEIIYSINFPCRPGIKGVWNSMAQRESLAISKVNIGVSYVLDPDLEEGVGFNYLQVAFGAVGPTVLRARQVEEYLRAEPLSAQRLERACQLAQSEVSPISDVRSQADYRRAMPGVLLYDALSPLL